MAVKIEQTPGGVRLWLKVVPGASRDRIVGALGDALKIAVAKPPHDGAANRAVVALLAAQLQVPLAQVQIVRGHGNPRKEVFIGGLSSDTVLLRLALR